MGEATKAAVIDLGTARTKIMTATLNEDGTIESKTSKEETALGKQFSKDGFIEHQAVIDLISFLKKVLASLAKDEITDILLIGTSAIRDANNSSEVIEKIETAIGPINILTQDIEGRIFYNGLCEAYPKLNDFVAVDIGGGSVQVVYRNLVFMLPTGTFRLEAEFQKGNNELTDQITSIERYLNQEVAKIGSFFGRHEEIIVGSNFMYDFFSSMYKYCFHRLPPNQINGLVAITKEDALEMYKHIRAKPYQDLAPYYPSNPGFMFGADKALINCLAISNHLSAKYIIPTNESISSALGRLIITNKGLSELGLKKLMM